jgi:predicted amidohydrolase
MCVLPPPHHALHRLLPVAESPVGDLGLTVCYDLRFPEVGIAASLSPLLLQLLAYRFTLALASHCRMERRHTRSTSRE